MAYSDFTLKKIQKDFKLEIIEKFSFFVDIKEITISEHLKITLEENIPIAMAINTEKARSELIIINILLELKRLFKKQISFFSGIDFNIDKDLGFWGFCDFIITKSSEQLFIKAPIIAIVEAKNENVMAGLGQCISEMLAAKIFNEQEEANISSIYGIITSGTVWKFLKLEENKIIIDLKDYSIEHSEKIIGIISAMIRQEA